MEILKTVAIYLGVFAGLVASLSVIFKSPVVGRPLRFVWRRLVAQPLSDWFRGIVAEAATEHVTKVLFAPNSGKSLVDLAAKVDRIESYLTINRETTDDQD